MTEEERAAARAVAIMLIQQLRIPRDELDQAADEIGVPRLSDEEWAEIAS